MIQTILFDMDGTLIDTEPSAAAAVAQCFSEWGVPLDPNDANIIVGRTWDSAFQFLFSKYKVPVAEAEAERLMLQRYKTRMEEDLTSVPGSVDAVKSLAKEFKLGLVSGSHRNQILFALEKLGIRQYFEIVLGAEDYPLSKPAPDGYLKALRQLGSHASETLIFEDSSAGIASGRQAGAWVVAITSTNYFGQDNSEAHEKLEDLRPVNPKWVREFEQRMERSFR